MVFIFYFIFSVTTERRDPGERQNRSLVHNFSAALGDDDSPPWFLSTFSSARPLHEETQKHN